MDFRPSSRRIVVGLLGAMLLVLWGFVAYWSWSQRKGVLTSSTVILEQLTTAAEEQTLRLFRHAETSLAVSNLWLAEHPQMDPGDTPAFIALVDRLRHMSDGMLDIRMVTRSGGLHYIPKRGAKPLADVSDRDYVKAQARMETRGFYIGNPVISRVSGKWGIPVSVPVDKGGGDTGVLFAAIELDRIAKTFEAERIKPSGSIAILRADGTFLFRVPQEDHVIGLNIADTPSFKENYALALKGIFRSASQFVDGKERLVSFQRLRDYPLIVIVTAGIDDLLTPWRRQTATLASIAGLVTLAVSLLALILLRAMKAEEQAQMATDRARREAELILSTAGEGICGIDAQGRVTFMNPAARAMLGWEHEDPIGNDLHATNHHSHPDGSAYPHEDCPILGTLRDGETREVQGETFWRTNGGSFPVEFIVTGIWDRNSVKGAVLVFRDISERLAAERAMTQQATELARSNADLEQFAYIASHDLREPLRQVASFVSLLERRYGATLDSDARDYITYARDGAKRMDRLMIDLLEFSRIGHRALPVEAVNLGDAIDEAIANLRTTIVETGAQVERAPGMPVLDLVRDDMVRLFQNLVGNALKYRHPERTPIVRISAVNADGGWVVSVTDNGMGIDPQFSERIFGIFQRLHTRDKFEGTGIGLAIVKKIVERAGGRVWVDSTAGEGSAFNVFLPA
ncbi:Putative Signal transduction histidine kinase(Signal transduction histidine kinase, homodimeric,447-535;ATPase-like, ATP-binding domain,531-684) [Magnetospirillum sp. XM-1]|nr:Putative Signal transduction histidine kinase(Signal transduction histidine kinase, homodimeric,447-535;ATPase-like, ATP-binding domain,531-684) [Magnetospirillum sp. XM-1]